MLPRLLRWVGGLGVVLGRWGGGGPWLGGVGGLSLVGSGSWFFFTWRCPAPEGSRLPSVMGVVFLLFSIHLALAGWPSVSKKKKKKKNLRIPARFRPSLGTSH